MCIQAAGFIVYYYGHKGDDGRDRARIEKMIQGLGAMLEETMEAQRPAPWWSQKSRIEKKVIEERHENKWLLVPFSTESVRVKASDSSRRPQRTSGGGECRYRETSDGDLVRELLRLTGKYETRGRNFSEASLDDQVFREHCAVEDPEYSR